MGGRSMKDAWVVNSSLSLSLLIICERKEGFTKNTAMRHRRVGGRAVTVTAMPHRQEYKDIELDIVIDKIGPGEGLLDSGGMMNYNSCVIHSNYYT